MSVQPGAASRRYRRPTDSVQRMRTMRMINSVRALILRSALEEEELEVEVSKRGQEEFVARHRKLQQKLAGHFPYLEIRGDQYASDIAQALAKDIVYYILHGDTPGGT